MGKNICHVRGRRGGVAVPHFPRKKGEIKTYTKRKKYIGGVIYMYFSRVCNVIFGNNWGIGEYKLMVVLYIPY